MKEPAVYNFQRYLAAKKSVDDRALNRHVWGTLAATLSQNIAVRPLRILELGSGIGTMVERIIEWGLLESCEYTALDNQRENATSALDRLSKWASESGFIFNRQVNHIQLHEPKRSYNIHFITSELENFLNQNSGNRYWDLLLANAFLDLIDIPLILPNLLGLLRSTGLFYFSINFDGVTILEPAIDNDFDQKITALYHHSMDERTIHGIRSGDSRTGRHLFHHLQQAGAAIAAAGSSDWVVFPTDGGYPEDEAYFLHFIINTIYQALGNSPDLDQSEFTNWIAKRHRQIDRGKLILIAHQIDFVGHF